MLSRSRIIIALLLVFLFVGQSAMTAYAYTIEPEKPDTADNASGIMLEEKSYDPATGIITILISGKLSNAAGYLSIGVLLTFDNTKLTLCNHSDYGASTVAISPDNEKVDLSSDYDVIKPLLTSAMRRPYTVQDSFAYKQGTRTAYRTFLYYQGAPNSSQLTTDWIPVLEICFKVTGNPKDLTTVLNRDAIRFGDVSKDRSVMDGVFPSKTEYSVIAITNGASTSYKCFGKMSGTGSLETNYKIMPATIVYTGSDNLTTGSQSGSNDTENSKQPGDTGDANKPSSTEDASKPGDIGDANQPAAPEISGQPGTSGSTNAPDAGWNNPFKDVNATDWFYSAVQDVFQRGLMLGISTDTFSWNTTLTRAMIVTILYRNANNPDVSGFNNPFNDVKNGLWYTDAVKWASANEIVLGYGNGKFGTNDAVTKEQLATLIYRTQQSSGLIPPVQKIENKYPDWGKISSWAKKGADELLAQGIFIDIPGTNFNPQDPATRAEIASMLHRYVGAVQQ